MTRILAAAILIVAISLLVASCWIWPSPDPQSPPEGSTPGETTAAPPEPTSPRWEADHGSPTTQERNLPPTGGPQ